MRTSTMWWRPSAGINPEQADPRGGSGRRCAPIPGPPCVQQLSSLMRYLRTPRRTRLALDQGMIPLDRAR